MAMNDLFQALNMFNQGATELATGRAIRSASEQAQQINMMEGKEFEKRQAFQNLGQGLAAQLSAVGASPQQVQQMSANYMPQQLQGPQDFFAQAAMAKTPEAQKQWQQAGQQIQKNVAAAPMTTFQNEQMKQQWASLIGMQQQAQAAGRDKLAEETAKRQVPDFQVMPGIIPQEEDVKKLKQGNETRISLLSSISKLDKMLAKPGLFGQSGTEAFSLTSNDATVMESLYKGALSKIRIMEELGVLNEADVPYLEGQLPDPTSMFSSGSKVRETYKVFMEELNDRVAAKAMSRGYIPSASSPLRKNAIKIQQAEAARKEIQTMEQQLQTVSPNDPNYELLQKSIEAARNMTPRGF